MTTLIKVYENSPEGEHFELDIKYQTEGESHVHFRFSLLKAGEENAILTTDEFVDVSSVKTPELTAFDPGTYAAGVLYCASKKLIIEAAKCHDEGARTAKDLIKCLKGKGKSISISMAICLAKGFFA